MKRSNITLAISTLTASLFLTACNNGGGSGSDNNSQPSTPSSYVSETAYVNEADTLKEVPQADSVKVIKYKMPNVLGKTVETSALVYFPTIAPPKDGYRVIVWTHGTLGGADKCAPTNAGLGDRFNDYIAKDLLGQGYVIVAPDYEGLGGEGEHPYLNLPSEAKSAIYAVKAAKEHYGTKLNGAWMSVGQSQGGQASLGVAEYANADASYKGAVAGAPASSLGKIILEVAPDAIKGLPKSVQIETYATLLAYTALAGVGITAYEPNFDYKKMFGTTKAGEIADLAKTECLDEIQDEYSKEIQAFVAANPDKNDLMKDYPGINREEFETDEVVKKFLSDYSQPTTKKLNKPILIVQGVYDTNVPYTVTYDLYDKMSKAGTNVSMIPVPIAPSASAPVVNGSHTGAILYATQTGQLRDFVKLYMPAQ
ncbi:prolyl oligopeptidase family serine peptidase [Acinetobacter corruptisaponis]|uniref:Prolyl oligopeptidase family serine peptidase n=1 Tax=Acinetobacter corruptisaponis TaxID=3045147 RepID=A0ABY8S7N7_9GAMM|nr:prolyl oligopeptidase family serine peptidase [Acinetobacter sp. KCTC 92772]WHP06822.1 prolyl oligopeptidase family serine peptidase [Acinetobacter sp. KCTC 92772]